MSEQSQGFNPVEIVRNFVRNSPWVAIAVAIHLILIAIATVMVQTSDSTTQEEAEVTMVVSKQKPKEEEVVLPPETIDRKAIPKNEEAELVTFEEDVYVPTTEQVEDLTQERGDPNSTDSLPSGGTTGGTAIGVGAAGHAGSGRPSPFGGRKLGSGLKKGRGGGPTAGTEKAVLEGLRWLCRHQMENGSWSVPGLKEKCVPEAPCYDPKENFNDHYDEGCTGLALLAFLGAGLSHESKIDIVDTSLGKRYKAGEVVKKGLQWLVKRQKPDGSFSKDRPYMYNEALATMAVTEAYGLSQNRFWREPAQKALDFLSGAQRPNPTNEQSLWGWRYESRQEIEDFRKGTSQDDSYKKQLFESDTSVTGWCVMALKSGRLSGLEVKDENFKGAMDFCKWITADAGLVGYVDPKAAGATVTGKNDHFIYHKGTMSSLGMCIRIFSEHDPEDPFLEQAAKVLVADLPTVSKDKLSVDYYYWYYGSLALNQFDGPDSPRKSGKYWGPWNKAMVDAVISMQNTTERSCTRGGWIDIDRWAYTGGPIYTTAINVLTLEVYYRYENAFGGAKRN